MKPGKRGHVSDAWYTKPGKLVIFSDLSVTFFGQHSLAGTVMEAFKADAKKEQSYNCYFIKLSYVITKLTLFSIQFFQFGQV